VSYPRVIHEWTTEPASEMTLPQTYRLVAVRLCGDKHTEWYAIEKLRLDSMGNAKWDLWESTDDTLDATHVLAAALSQLQRLTSSA